MLPSCCHQADTRGCNLLSPRCHQVVTKLSPSHQVGDSNQLPTLVNACCCGRDEQWIEFCQKRWPCYRVYVRSDQQSDMKQQKSDSRSERDFYPIFEETKWFWVRYALIQLPLSWFNQWMGMKIWKWRLYSQENFNSSGEWWVWLRE